MISDSAPILKARIAIDDVAAVRDALHIAIRELERRMDIHFDQSEGAPCPFAPSFDYAINALAEIDQQLATVEAAQ